MADKSDIKISVDEKGNKIVIIPQVIFKGKRSISKCYGNKRRDIYR